MFRVVLDTNVVVSAVISDSKSRDLLRKGIANQFSIVTSDLILKEIVTVLRRPKFKTTEDEIHRIILALIRSSEIVNVKSKFEAVKEDPKDNIIINTAYDGHADIIVTGDKHLLKLKNFTGIKVITIESMLKLLQSYEKGDRS
jgi:putative PIN family toxin of toxin-antitoxin system